MLACNENGTAMMLDSCSNAMLCEAGLATGHCASCIPGEATCNGKDLQRCSVDGSGFQLEMDCKSAPLCDQSGGSCKPPVCEAGTYTCNRDSLDLCKPDMTGYTSKPCLPGLCDASSKSCLACKPGSSTCSGTNLLTCNAQGQRMDVKAACSGAQPLCDADSAACVECLSSRDCTTDNACAAANGCSAGKCAFKPRFSAPSTSGNGATIRSGTMDPDPIYVSYGRALFWIPTPSELDAYYGGYASVVVANGSITGYSRCPVLGTLIRERGDPHVYVSTSRGLEWVKDPNYLAQCPWAINDVPTGSLHNTQYPSPAGNCTLIEN